MSKQLPADDYSMSDNTRRMIDEEMQYLIDLAHRRAMKLVGENRTLLEAFAFMLLENEVLERDDIERLVGAYQGQTRPLNGAPVLKSLEPGPAEIAAAEAEQPPTPD
jgi:cell division protease FtsH